MRREELFALLQMLISAGTIHPNDAKVMLRGLAAKVRSLPVESDVEDHREGLALAYETLRETLV